MLKAYFVSVYPERDWDFRCDNLAFAFSPEEAIEVCKSRIDPPLTDDDSELRAERKPEHDHLVRSDKNEAYVENRWGTLRLAGFMSEGEDRCEECELYPMGFDEYWVDPETLICRPCAALLKGEE